MATEPTTRQAAEPSAQIGAERLSLNWSKWFRCESSFGLLLVPEQAGIYAVAEEVLAPGESATTGGKRLLALVQFAETDNLARALSRLFTPASPLQERIAGGHCLLRYAVVEEESARQAAYAALQTWLAASAEAVAPAPEARQTNRDLEPPALPAGF
ncbi:MAG TPA: hypothetical protein VKT29_06320 [Terriglobales bacterium]|nr:hypothetical protein [Terriglobales bacterium]